MGNSRDDNRFYDIARFEPLAVLIPLQATRSQKYRSIMATTAPNPDVNWYFAKNRGWHDEFVLLRKIALGSRLDEELKWGHPCYTVNGKNVVLMHGFKDYCALLFLKGALLKDGQSVLVQQTASVQSARQVRFTSVQEIKKLEPTLKRLIRDAIEVERKGVKVAFKRTEDFAIPPEFSARLKAQPSLKKAFMSLTPGRQRGYLLFFGSAKQSKTREARIEKNVDRILDGKGLDD